jgi:hypothetical protein
LSNTTSYYARYTTSVICNAIIQNSIKPCNLSNEQSPPLCADTCVSLVPFLLGNALTFFKAQQAISEEEISVNGQLCSNPKQDFVSQIRADFIQCSLPANALSGSCINGAQNEPNDCGFSNNLDGLCRYCGASSPNATDTCCYNSNATGRCAGVVLPTLSSMPSLMLNATSSPTSSPTSTSASVSDNGLSGGAIAGIVIGSIVAAILLIGLILLGCLCWRRRRTTQHGSLNQPSPKRSPQSAGAVLGRDVIPAPGGRVARMTALEGNSSEEKKMYEGHSDSDPSEGTPRSRRQAPLTSQRRGSLSSNSMFGGLEDSSPSQPFSSPDGVQSGQSEQLPYFKDYYSSDEIHPGDKVATLWAYQPRAADEFELERGDMLKVVGIWDDGWATGVRISDRAEDYDGKHKMQRDSGVSNVTGQREPTSPLAIGEVKAFPLVCVCLPEHWKKTIEGDSSNETGSQPGAQHPFPNF